MTADHETDLDRELEAFFQAARDTPPLAPPQLLARVLSDAYEVQDAHLAAAAARPAPADVAEPPDRRRRPLGGLFDLLGGWVGVAGLATATLAGIWIGYNPPAALDTLSLELLDGSYGLTMSSSLPDYDFLLADG